jgi:hypothetical protein
MFKVIVERPRWGSNHAGAVKLKKDPDRDRKAIGLKRHAQERADYCKGFNENLAPLIRFLVSRRGRRWDDVFSEICAGLDTGSTVKMHVRQHLEDFVAVRITRGRYGEWLRDGRPIESDDRFARQPDFYVDPDDGVLKDSATFWRERGREIPSRNAARRARRPEEITPDLRRLDDTRLLCRRNGCWFLYELDARPKGSDILLHTALLNAIRCPGCGWPTHRDWSIVAFHQLSKRELKRFALSNGGADDD